MGHVCGEPTLSQHLAAVASGRYLVPLPIKMYLAVSDPRAGWTRIEVDLSACAGDIVLVRFEQVTDGVIAVSPAAPLTLAPASRTLSGGS